MGSKKTSGITVTKVSVYPYQKKKGEKTSLKAFASVTLNDEFVVTNIRLIDGKKGMFIAMPARPDTNEEYHDICFPVVSDLREAMTKAIIDEYEKDE